MGIHVGNSKQDGKKKKSNSKNERNPLQMELREAARLATEPSKSKNVNCDRNWNLEQIPQVDQKISS